jgi:hypothetical protein
MHPEQGVDTAEGGHAREGLDRSSMDSPVDVQ